MDDSGYGRRNGGIGRCEVLACGGAEAPAGVGVRACEQGGRGCGAPEEGPSSARFGAG